MWANSGHAISIPIFVMSSSRKVDVCIVFLKISSIGGERGGAQKLIDEGLGMAYRSSGCWRNTDDSPNQSAEVARRMRENRRCFPLCCCAPSACRWVGILYPGWRRAAGPRSLPWAMVCNAFSVEGLVPFWSTFVRHSEDYGEKHCVPPVHVAVSTTPTPKRVVPSILRGDPARP